MRERYFVYPADLTAEPEGGMTVTFPDIPEAITFGADHEDAIMQAEDALNTAVDEYLRRGLALPEPSRVGKRQVAVPVDTVLALKAALQEALGQSGLSKAAFARRLGTDAKEVQRLLDPRHASKVRRMTEALRSLGRSVAVAVS